MKNIIEIKNDRELENLFELGRSCDIDLNHLPFELFTIRVSMNENSNRNMAEKAAKEKIKDMNIKDPIIANMMIKDMVEDIMINKKVSFVDKNYKIKDNKLYVYDDMILIAISDFPNDGIFHTEDIKKLSTEISVSDKSISLDKIIEMQGGKHAFKNNIMNDVFLSFGVLAVFQAVKTPIPYKKSIYKKDNSKSKKISKRNKYTYVNTKIYDLSLNDILNKEYKNDDDFKDISKRKYTNHISVWYQRGHWRTYKSGKRIWVKPCFKKHKDISENDSNKKDMLYRLNRI